METLRSATINDAKLFFDLWNENVACTRAGKILNWEEHATWFAAALRNPAHALFVCVSSDAVPIGIARATLRDGMWHLSWALIPPARGKGFGSILVQALIAALRTDHPNVSFIVEIKSDNIPSLRIVERLGFVKMSEQDGFMLWACSAAAANL